MTRFQAAMRYPSWHTLREVARDSSGGTSNNSRTEQQQEAPAIRSEFKIFSMSRQISGANYNAVRNKPFSHRRRDSLFTFGSEWEKFCFFFTLSSFFLYLFSISFYVYYHFPSPNSSSWRDF